MKAQFLKATHSNPNTPDIFADKSALVLQWLLLSGIEKEAFSLREVASDTRVGVSLGLVQRVFEHLVREGFLAAVGVRTAKSFKLIKPKSLLMTWTEHYSITNKCKIWNYRTSLGSREEVVNVLKRSSLWSKTCLALHSAAEFHNCQNTNLQTTEIYISDPECRPQLEKKLELQPQERGYEVLLVSPYYKAMLSDRKSSSKRLECAKLKVPATNLFYSPALLTYLDLYNFPLRGREQAEFMAQRILELKRIFKRE